MSILSASLSSVNQAKEQLYKICQETDDASKVNEILSKYPQLLNEDLDKDKRTALYLSAINNRIEITKLLLSYKDINVNIQTKYGYTALYAASDKGHINIVKELLQHPKIDVNIQDMDGYTALYIASYIGHIDVVKELLQHPNIDVNIQNKSGCTALYRASYNGHTSINIVKELLQHPKIDVNIQNKDGNTALYRASYNGHTSINIVKELLQHPNINVNIQNKDGNTALHNASYNGYIEIVKELLQHPKIDVNIQTNDGKTASDVCCDCLTDKSKKPLILELFENHRREKISATPNPTTNTTEPKATTIATSDEQVNEREKSHSPVMIEARGESISSKADPASPSPPVLSAATLPEGDLSFLPATIRSCYYRLKLSTSEKAVAEARRAKYVARIKEMVRKHRANEELYGGLLAANKDHLPDGFDEADVKTQLTTLTTALHNSIEALYGEAETDEEFEVIERMERFERSLKDEFADELLLGSSGEEGPVKSGDGNLSPATLPLPAGKTTHIFLTHTWRKDDEGRDNHKRVGRINDALKRRGIITWFDSDRMSGAVRQAMTDALYGTCSVLICISREYETKINSKNESDNCYYEFDVAANHEDLVNKRIPIVMEKSMLNPSAWKPGRLKAEVGGKLFFDVSSDEEAMIERRCDEIVRRLRELLGV